MAVVETFDLEAAWHATFEADLAAKVEQTGVDSTLWRAGGRATKAYPNKEDGQWWRDNGLAFSKAWVDWRESVAWQIWETPAGEPAIELDLRCSFGDVPVRTIIDRIFVTPDGELAVVDIKTGASAPKDQGLQLGFYASAVEQVFGQRPSLCTYWNARKGGIGEFISVDHLTPAFLGHLLGEFVKARDMGLYLPNLSQNCSNCGVRRACAAVNGEEAHVYDPLYLKEK